MKRLLSSEKIYLSKSRISKAGRGVFANRKIKIGESVERCPIIEVPEGDTSKLHESMLVTYFFNYGRNKNKLAIALGLGSIYNHSDKPNVRFTIIQKDKLIEFVAIKEIKKDEEITFNYYNSNNSKNKERPLWFVV